MREITNKLRKDQHLPKKKVYNVEAMKLFLDDALFDFGAFLRLHTFVAGVEKS